MTEFEPVVGVRDAQPYVGTSRHVTMATMVPTLPEATTVVHDWLVTHGHTATGAPFWRYRVVDMPNGLEIEVAFPLAEQVPVAAGAPVQSGELPAGRYVTATYVGHPDGLEQATGQLLEWAAREGLQWDMERREDGEHWAARLEVYLSDPDVEPDMTAWRTELLFKLAD